MKILITTVEEKLTQKRPKITTTNTKISQYELLTL